MRLNKFLAHAGVASRRKCDELIRAGKVSINGAIVRDFSRQVEDSDAVQVDGLTVESDSESIILKMNKALGVVTTVSDESGRKTVMDLIDSPHRLFPIGRLDRNSSGVLLFTNDGDLANRLLHPRYEIKKRYLVQTRNDLPNHILAKHRGRFTLEDGSIANAKLTRLESNKQNTVWHVDLKEGKKREIRRIFTALGTKVERLHRVSFAGISADDLKPGKSRRLNKAERKIIKDIIHGH